MDTCGRQAEHVGGRQPHVNIATFQKYAFKQTNWEAANDVNHT